MLQYIVRRLLQSLSVLFLSSVFVFFFIRLIPGDTAMVIAGVNATPEQVQALRAKFGTDQMLVTQYVRWVARLAQGDLGTSYVGNRPIGQLILQRIPATLHLALGAMLVVIVIGGSFGIFSAVRPLHPFSRFTDLFCALALATPTFWLGILVIMLFSLRLHWFPASGYVSVMDDPLKAVRLLFLPSITLGIGGAGVLSRFLKSSISEVIGSQFVRMAQAKGLSEYMVVGRHVLRAALGPVVTIMAIQFGHLLGGAVITEGIFGWPGVGRLTLDAIGNRDYLIVQGTMFCFVTTFILLNILADVICAFLDPRIRYS